MIFADKLIELRKKSGWSQEELAEQMQVTRQSVSKWEGAQSIPDLEKIIRLSELFGVSTDYLLKDDIDIEEKISCVKEETNRYTVSMEEANAFLRAKSETAKPMALGVFLCILCPVPLLLLGGMSEVPKYHLSENAAGGVGMIVMLLLVCIAVGLFILCDSKTSSYAHLEKEVFETAYGVEGMVKDRKEAYKSTYYRNNIIGTCACILSVVPLFCGAIFHEDDDFLILRMLSLGFVIVSLGVACMVYSGVIWGGFQILLQEGEYSVRKKGRPQIIAVVSTVYWLTITAIYLVYSLFTANWGYSWIIWVGAGVMYPAILSVLELLVKRK